MNYSNFATEENTIIIRNIDWKDELNNNKDILKEFKNHVKKYPGTIFMELDVYTADDKVYYAGQPGLDGWVGNKCAFEELCDKTFVVNENDEAFEPEEVYFHPKVGLFVKYKDKFYSTDEFVETFS